MRNALHMEKRRSRLKVILLTLVLLGVVAILYAQSPPDNRIPCYGSTASNPPQPYPVGCNYWPELDSVMGVTQVPVMVMPSPQFDLRTATEKRGTEVCVQELKLVGRELELCADIWGRGVTFGMEWTLAGLLDALKR